MKTTTWITVAAVAALGSSALAQQQPPSRPDQSGHAQDAAVRPFELYKLNALVGIEVKGAKNDTAGKIDDLVLNANDGEIDFVVLASGGVAGIGDTKRILPWRDLQLTPIVKDGDRKCEARVTLTEDQVKALREFDKKNAKSGGTPKPTDPSRKDDPNAEATMTSIATCTTEVKGHKVVDQANQSLGEIDEVMIDATAGRVAYVVLGVGGTLGMGEKHFALPWSALGLEREANGDLKVHANLSKERLANAPEFDREHLDKMSSPEWMRTVYGFYSVDPYWSGARPASSGGREKPH